MYRRLSVAAFIGLTGCVQGTVSNPFDGFTNEGVVAVDYQYPSDTPGIIIKGTIVDTPAFNDPIELMFRAALQQNAPEIIIVLDSNGGSNVAGGKVITLIDRAKAFGTRVTCIADGMVYSMAAVIFSNCSRRLSTTKATFLWHSSMVFAQGYINEFIAKDQAADLALTNSVLWWRLKRHFNASYFDKHYKNETIIKAKDILANSTQLLQIINSYGEIK